MQKVDQKYESWKQRTEVLVKYYNSTTKERRVCKKCNHPNPFFKIDCEKCRFKFTKTRADRGAGGVGDRGATNILNPLNNSSMNTDNLSVFFWELLQANNDTFG